MPNVVITKTINSYPITLNEAKRHLKVVDFVDDDNYIDALIEAATNQCSNYIGKDIANTSCVASFYDFSGSLIRIDEGNYISTNNVISDTSTLLSVSATKVYNNYAEILLTNSVSSTTEYTPLKVEYTSGYTNAAACPTIIKQAILVKIGDMYDVERSSYEYSGYKDNKVFERMLESYKQILF